MTLAQVSNAIRGAPLVRVSYQLKLGSAVNARNRRRRRRSRHLKRLLLLRATLKLVDGLSDHVVEA